ncbi:MAG TPA: type II toxin-antitoxin system RelE/ParE family toxin [Chloroflexota bacterium]|nr:type II toxin-antitoxin system RelE/ParE family toxin [Chloroflexota bacterium]
MRVVLSREARANLREIAAHVAKYTDTAQGDLVAARVQVAAEDLLSRQPRLGRPWRTRGTRYVIIRVRTHTYRIIYRLTDTQALIEQIRDTRRQDNTT